MFFGDLKCERKAPRIRRFFFDNEIRALSIQESVKRHYGLFRGVRRDLRSGSLRVTF